MFEQVNLTTLLFQIFIYVQLMSKAKSIMDVSGEILVYQQINLWSPAYGNLILLSSRQDLSPYKQKFPTGTFIFISAISSQSLPNLI
jgi:hypothetical protein